MSDRVFLDTNILVYAHDVSAGPKNAIARDLVTELWAHKTGCLSIQVFQEFYVTVTQKVPRRMDPADAETILRGLSYWYVHEPKTEDVFQAIALQKRYQLSFWDAMIVQSAVQLECGQIWSEEMNPGQIYAGVQLVNPFQP